MKTLLYCDKTGNSALDAAVAFGGLDQLLGIELSEQTLTMHKARIPDEWVARNRKICEDRMRSKAKLAEQVEEHDIEIF